MLRNCTICGKPIVLTPTAEERAAKDRSGNTAAYYTNLFREHGTCVIEKRAKEASELMKEIKLNG